MATKRDTRNYSTRTQTQDGDKNNVVKDEGKNSEVIDGESELKTEDGDENNEEKETQDGDKNNVVKDVDSELVKGDKNNVVKDVDSELVTEDGDKNNVVKDEGNNSEVKDVDSELKKEKGIDVKRNEENYVDSELKKGKGITERPLITGRSLITKRPLITERPLITKKPLITGRSLITKRPLITEQPLITKIPLITHHQKNHRQDFYNRGSVAKTGYITPVLPKHPHTSTRVDSSVATLRWHNKNLNGEQKLAVVRILEGRTRPLPYIIYGPPGTGKTITIVETILQIIHLIPDSRVLVVTPSNSATDLLAERLVLSGGLNTTQLLRLNAYQRSDESIPPLLRPYSETGDSVVSGEGIVTGVAMRRVTASTATTAGLLYTLGLHTRHYTHVLVDEAGQLTEPETLLVMGLVNGVSGQIVLAGDPQQLGPVVMSGTAGRFGLKESLLHRLCQSVLYQPHVEGAAWYHEPSLVTQLVHNYRSQPDILTVPDKLFYHNTLIYSADLKPLHYLLDWSELVRPGYPLLFHGILGDNIQEGDSPSWFNPQEVFQVVTYSKSLICYGVSPNDIGIITPYRKQVEKIMKLLLTFGLGNSVKVGSVEEFQGQERQVVLISTVRSATQQTGVETGLGFVCCPRRFNVAVTRAMGLLIMIGDPILLLHDNTWKHIIQQCISQGAYRGPDVVTLETLSRTSCGNTGHLTHDMMW